MQKCVWHVTLFRCVRFCCVENLSKKSAVLELVLVYLWRASGFRFAVSGFASILFQVRKHKRNRHTSYRDTKTSQPLSTEYVTAMATVFARKALLPNTLATCIAF